MNESETDRRKNKATQTDRVFRRFSLFDGLFKTSHINACQQLFLIGHSKVCKQSGRVVSAQEGKGE
jgi:hypothetical protein